ncbi:Peptidase T2 asparaginase 2 [Trinorchestia longiramus]|nr:Peptidase T2 asparaginase 2 [Trinorchestia longiramus]
MMTSSTGANLPFVINTWPFTNATEKAWAVLSVEGGGVLDAVEQGCTVCEREQCDGTVGYGGSPDEHGETTLDALIMDGATHDVGAVAALRQVKDAISVARHVLHYTDHTLLVGSQATEFALSMGFKQENLTTPTSAGMHESWKEANCQPNFWKNVVPDPTTSCGPYSPGTVAGNEASGGPRTFFGRFNHDTIGMIAIDGNGNIAGGTSTNGARNKIPGRVGDSPIPGSGCYVDRKIGGAVATGDGDVMMRLLPALVAVEKMRDGFSPEEASRLSLDRVVEYYPNFEGAIVSAGLDGSHGAACHGFSWFKYSLADASTLGVITVDVPCT